MLVCRELSAFLDRAGDYSERYSDTVVTLFETQDNAFGIDLQGDVWVPG